MNTRAAEVKPQAALHGLTRKLGLPVVLGVLSVAALSAYGDFDEIRASLAVLDGLYIWLALAASFLSFLPRALRFQIYLRCVSVRIGLFEAVVVFCAGMSMTITPGKVGEVLKSFLLKWAHGTPIATTSPIVVSERVSDLIALLLLSAWGALALPAGIWIASACVLLSILAALLSASVLVQKWFIRIAQKVPYLNRKAHRLEAMLESLVSTTRFKPFAFGLVLSLLAWWCQVLSVKWVVLGLPDASLSLQQAALAYCAPLIAGVLAFVPGGLGVTEVGMAGVLQAIGGTWATPAAAATVTILARLITLWFAVAVGAVALLMHRHWRGWSGSQ